MQHSKFQASIDAYLEGCLDSVQLFEFRQHSQTCQDCRIVLSKSFRQRLGDGQVGFDTPDTKECYNDETLKRWASLELTEALMDLVSDHVMQCPDCAERANGFLMESIGDISTNETDGCECPVLPQSKARLRNVVVTPLQHHGHGDVTRREFVSAAMLSAIGLSTFLTLDRIVGSARATSWSKGRAFAGGVDYPILSASETRFLCSAICGKALSLNVVAGGPDDDSKMVYADDQWAASSITTGILGMPANAPELLAGDLPQGSVLAVASPTSIPGIEPFFASGNPLNLPVTYTYQKPKRTGGANYFDMGGKWKSGSVGKGLLASDFGALPVAVHAGADRELLSDYLLVTVVPNPSDLASRLVVIAGAHGVATQSVVRVFENRCLKDWLFEQIAKSKQRSPFLQAWFRIKNILHDRVAKTSIGQLSEDPEDRAFYSLPFDETLDRTAAFVARLNSQSHE